MTWTRQTVLAELTTASSRRRVARIHSSSRYRATVSFGPNFAYGLCVEQVREKDVQGLDLSSWRVAGCAAVATVTISAYLVALR